MSGKISISFEITNMLIMEETLKRLGQSFTKNSEGLTIAKSFYNIEITKDNISCYTNETCLVERIKSEYQRDFQINERAIRGEQFELTETSNEIILLVH